MGIMGEDKNGAKTIKSTQTAFDIIETISRKEYPNLSEITAETENARSTIHYHLNTLQENRYVIKDEQGYRLGLRLTHLGNIALQHYELNEIVEKPVDTLGADTNAISQVVVIEDGKATTLFKSAHTEIDGYQIDVGTATDIHCTAYGQAILAHLSTDEVEEIIAAHGLPEHTENTITDESQLFERLEDVRNQGFSYTEEEHVLGISSIAAPLLTQVSNEVIGAVGITNVDDELSKPKYIKAKRFTDTYSGKVQRTAQIIDDKVADIRKQ